jgi:hypothetical protein
VILMIHEVLEKAVLLKTKKAKIKFLKENNTLALRDILRGSFDDGIVFTLPKGSPPFNQDDAPVGYSRTTLQHVTNRFSYFVKGGKGDALQRPKVERMFIEILEGVHVKEAELVILMKDKKLTSVYKGITKSLVNEVFPELIKQ